MSRQSLIQAIATLESQRDTLGDGERLDRAVQTALAALRDKLSQLQARSADDQYRQLGVLVTDLSGFTALSERMDAERVREALNAMWRELDAVITAWGGQIDQHAGDSLVALFGLPQPRANDVERALHAALSMQLALSLFNERVRLEAQDGGGVGWADEWPAPQMRVGVHSGPVLFASVGVGGRRTAVGDALNVARRLETMAPAGGVLVSAAVSQQAQPSFHLTLRPEQMLPPGGKHRLDGSVYLVERPRLNDEPVPPGRIAGQETRLIGRAAELDELEAALQAAVDGRSPQVVTLTGETGAGKSRLLYEFERRARLWVGDLVLLRGRADQTWPPTPFSLLRDALIRQFGIRPQHSPQIVEELLRQGVSRRRDDRATQGDGPWRRTPDVSEPADRELSSALRRLLFSQSAANVQDEVPAVITRLLGQTTKPIVFSLEDVEYADRESLALIDHLLQSGDELPLLILCTAGPDFAGRAQREGLMWAQTQDDPFAPGLIVEAPLLSIVESRLFATELLGRLGSTPLRLIELVAAESRGNPLYMEELVRLFIERGVITIGGQRWRVDMDQAESMHLPKTLQELTRMRLALLPPIEQMLLQQAAALGVFWDSALPTLGLATADNLDDAEVEMALVSLEKRGWIARSGMHSFGNTQAYVFERRLWRDVAYEIAPPEKRRAYHRQAAAWFVACRDLPGLPDWFPLPDLIAWHFAQAGETNQAAVWYRRAQRSQAAIAGSS